MSSQTRTTGAAGDRHADSTGVRVGVRVHDLSRTALRQLRQLGVEDVLVELPALRDGDGMPTRDQLEAARERVENADLEFAGIHTLPSETVDAIAFGEPEAEAQLDAIKTLVRDLGAVGGGLLGYDWALRVVRTESVTLRGGAEATGWSAEAMAESAPTELDEAPDAITESPPDEATMWNNYARFVDRVVPVAEAADVRLAVHPTDPPLVETVDGIPRLLRSVEAFDRAMDLADSRHHAIKLCLGCFAEMGADIPEVIHRFGERDRIGFVHFRNVAGTVPAFNETFIDEGDFDPAAAMRALQAVGYEGPVLPDHVPDVDGDAANPALLTGGVGSYGYTIGYLRALRDATATNGDR